MDGMSYPEPTPTPVAPLKLILKRIYIIFFN